MGLGFVVRIKVRVKGLFLGLGLEFGVIVWVGGFAVRISFRIRVFS